MLRDAKRLHGFSIHGTDGDVGKIDEVLFDDAHWTVRYLVVETGTWLSHRKVLLSPLAFGRLDWDAQVLSVHLAQAQIESSPNADTDQPVSRQWERSYYRHYTWPYYWGGMSQWGGYLYPDMLFAEATNNAQSPEEEAETDQADSHLRSTKEVRGYHVAAIDGHLGHVEDFLFDDATWRIALLAVDTGDWWPGQTILLPTDWITHVDWLERQVSVSTSRETIRNAPEWDRSTPIEAAEVAAAQRYFRESAALPEPVLQGDRR
jgi:uncharacterized protein YrrD